MKKILGDIRKSRNIKHGKDQKEKGETSRVNGISDEINKRRTRKMRDHKRRSENGSGMEEHQ